MANYHLSSKVISRADGRSAIGSIAYRSGEKILNERTGNIHDFTRKGGVEYSELILPSGNKIPRAEFWNALEKHHKRGDAVLIREIEISLPVELNEKQRKELAVSFSTELAKRYGVAADVAIHTPSGNPHAHISMSACSVGLDDKLGKKANELDPIHCARAKIPNCMDVVRKLWEERCNDYLAKAGHQTRIDHRSLKNQGIERAPQKHKGVAVTAMEKKGKKTDVMERMRIEKAKEDFELMQIRKAEMRELEQIKKSVDYEFAEKTIDYELKQARKAKTVQAPAPEKWFATSEPAPAPVQPAKLFTERLKESLLDVMAWAKEKLTGTKVIECDASKNTMYSGSFVYVNEMHALQKTNRNEVTVHQLDKLSKTPVLDDPKTEVRYKDGLGTVIGKKGHGLQL